MAVFHVERNKGYTVMSNHHLRNKELTYQKQIYQVPIPILSPDPSPLGQDAARANGNASAAGERK